MFDNDLHRSDY